MYHPPEARDELQFIELHNAGSNSINLAGWRLTQGVEANLSPTNLPPGGLTILCRDQVAFREHYGTSAFVLGTFTGRLKHSGERVRLERRDGSVADTVKFTDRPPWSLAADGDGASLERRTPLAPGDEVANWGPSVLPRNKVAGGTPGQTNSNYSARPIPWVGEVQFSPAQPNMPFSVTAEVDAAGGVRDVSLLWHSLRESSRVTDQSVRMERISGEATHGTYRATLPGQPAGRLLRFRIKVEAQDEGVRWAPDPNELRPTFSAYVLANTNQSRIAEVRLINWGAQERPGSSLRARGGDGRAEPVRGLSTFVVLPTNGGPVLTFDHIRLTPRQDGWKVRLHPDAPYVGITTLNVVHEGKPRWLLAEPLGYEVFRRAGVPAPLTGHVRVWVNGRPLGYSLYVEQLNSSFLRRVNRDTHGNLYKLLWYGEGLEGQHEQKNNSALGHQDLAAVMQGLGSEKGEAQWDFIQRTFNVEECVNYFAVGQCLQNWDGFFNNYFAYHEPGPAGRWEMFPWDLDKTWGDYDGASPKYDWYAMPLTYGMNGDKEPARWFAQRRHPWGSVEWWRPGGWFSGPLLANPQFRTRFLERLEALCQTEFTEERFGLVIDTLAETLEPEVRWRALMRGGDPRSAVAEFQEDLASFRRQLKERRAVLLRELAKVRR